MRVLFANERGAFFGGVEQHVAHLAGEFRQRGHACALAYGTADGRDAAQFRSIFDDTFEVPALAPEGARSPGWLEQLVRETRSDAVYLHKLNRLPDVSRLTGRTRLVQMVHDHDLCCPRRHKYFALNAKVCDRPAGWRCYLDGAFLERRTGAPFGLGLRSLAAHRAEMRRHWKLDALLVGSAWMREELLMNGAPEARVHVVAPSVPETARPLAAPPERGVVLYVGQLVRGKGLDRLLAAMAMVTRPWSLLVAGQGNQEGALRAQVAQLGLGDKVSFLGWVAPDQISGLYQRATVVAVPSRWPEPFGMVGLEAMRHARPVVGFDVGGIGDWLEDGRTGRLVPDGEVGAFALAIDQLLGEPSLAARMGLNGRLAGDARFSFPLCADLIERHLSGAPPAERSTA